MPGQGASNEYPQHMVFSRNKKKCQFSGMSILAGQVDFDLLFVCVEVLRPSQPNGVMLSAVSLPNHMFTGQV